MQTNSSPFGEWGEKEMEIIHHEFFLPSTGLYAQSATDKGPSGPCDAWTAGVIIEALASAAKYDPAKYTPWLLSYAKAMDAFWYTKPPVPGFAGGIGPGYGVRYYDDNEWMARGLIHAYEDTHDPALNQKAAEVLKFVWSGHDDLLGGGIYWRESDKASKNTCSNAPAATAMLEFDEAEHSTKWLSRAEGIYAWTKRTLQDPVTHLYWDNINDSGKVQKMEWTYNSALMLLAAKHLAAATGKPSYAADAETLEAASISKWLTPEGLINDPGRFSFLLVESWLYDSSPTSKPWLCARLALTNLHRLVRDPHGHYPDRWNDASGKVVKRWQLIDQAAAARAYFQMALAEKQHP